jgi:hypothetical protein
MQLSLKKLGVLACCTASNFNSATQAQIVVPDDYVGGFRLRMYWESGYNWQESNTERFWCMECDGNCEDGDEIRE